MRQLMDYPLLLSVLALAGFWLSAQFGTMMGKKRQDLQEPDKTEFGLVLGATLTLLGLLIGFSFSMAISRYEQRKNYEEEEANAIGTEYLRADLLPESVRPRVQRQLAQYLDLRIKRYEAHASEDISDIARKTTQLQEEMWAEVKTCAAENPYAVMATVVTGMNDVINRQGYTQAARWNRIPIPAWALMTLIALFSNFLIGYGAKDHRAFTLLIVPLVVAASFLLVADIDSPQGGMIRIVPNNLIALSNSLTPK